MCYSQPHYKEDNAVCYFQSHCEDIAVYLYKCVYPKESLECKVPIREGLNEWDMVAIYTNKTGDCLFICLSVRLWTEKPQGLTG